MHAIRAVVATAISAACLASCAPAPLTPPPGKSALTGVVRLVPHAGVPSQAGGGAYGDRRLRDVRYVDYSKPGSSVVYLDLGTRPGGRVQLEVEAASTGARLAPAFSAVGAGGEIAIANHTDAEAVVSVPALDRVERIAVGAEWRVAVDRAGPLEIFLLGSEEPARVWLAPGPWTRPDASGRFALDGLDPGRVTVRAWHPRLPSAAAEVELRPDETAVVDLEIGVGRSGDRHAH